MNGTSWGVGGWIKVKKSPLDFACIWCVCLQSCDYHSPYYVRRKCYSYFFDFHSIIPARTSLYILFHQRSAIAAMLSTKYIWKGDPSYFKSCPTGTCFKGNNSSRLTIILLNVFHNSKSTHMYLQYLNFHILLRRQLVNQATIIICKHPNFIIFFIGP